MVTLNIGNEDKINIITIEYYNIGNQHGPRGFDIARIDWLNGQDSIDFYISRQPISRRPNNIVAWTGSRTIPVNREYIGLEKLKEFYGLISKAQS